MQFVLGHLVLNGSVLVGYYLIFVLISQVFRDDYRRYQVRRICRIIPLSYFSWYTWGLESLAIANDALVHVRMTALIIAICALQNAVGCLIAKEERKASYDYR